MIHTMFVRRRAARAGLSGATSIFGTCLLLALVALAGLWPREAVAGGSVTGCTLTHTFSASPLNVAQRYDLTPADAAACSPNGDIQKDSGATAVGSGGGPGDTINGQHGTYTLEYDGGGAEWIFYTPTSSASGGYNESISFYGDDGGSVYNDTANITILSSGSAPDAPTIGTATAGNGQATITFSAPGSDGGSPITGYTATSNPGGKTGTCSASPCTVTGLTNGTAYTFTVTATNANGTSASSSASNSVTPTAPLTTLTYSAGTYDFTKGQADSTGTPTHDGGPLTGCTVSPTLPGGLTISPTDCTISGTPAVLQTLPVSYTVTASNASGSAQATVTIVVNDEPPTSLTYASGTYDFTVGQASTTGTPTRTGGAPTFCTATPALPGGLSINPLDCTISGTPTVRSVTTSYAVTVSNSGGSTIGSVSITVDAAKPGAPTIGAATAGDGQALVNFTPPAFNGGATITQYTATSDPGSLAGSCTTSPCVVTGLVNGIAYTFTVTATNSAGTGVPSTASTSVTPQASQTITFANPGPQNFGTTPTLSATASSGQPVTFTSSTTSVCTITSGGLLTTVSTGTCTILADQGGNGAYQPAPQVSQSFTIIAVAPGAPTIGTATAGDGQALVSFTPPAFTGGATITGYTVTSSPGGLATPCALSPCTVTGLSNGTAYAFTVMATNSAGTGTASGSSNSVTPKASQDITNFMATPANPVYSPGGTFHVSATGGGSINPVVFAIDPSSSAVCSISGATVTMLSAGTCTVTANQAGDAGHVAAPQVTLGVIITNPPAPTTSNVNASAAYNTATPIDLSSAIGGSDITAVTIGTLPSHGTAVVSGETVTYTPSSTFYGGTDTFTYTATNPGGTSAPATVTVTVGKPAAPTAANKTATTPYNTAAAIDLSSSITGVDITAVAIGTMPAHGTVSVSGETVTYTPASSYYGGTDTFTYTATNPGGTSAPATVTVTVGTPAAPAAAAKSTTTPYNTAAAIDLSGSITGVDITAVTIGTMPAHGTVSVSGETVTYTPASSYYGGTDTFTYTATNPGGTSAPATVTVTVGKPAAPTAANKTATTPYNTAASIDLSGSITGVGITGVTIGTAPSHGTVSVSGETVTYTPDSTYYGGSDNFTYTAINPGGTSAPATVTVTVGAPAAPTAAAKSVTTPYDAVASIDLSGSITGAGITAVTIGTVPTHGTVSVSGETVTYTPSSTYYGGTDSFTYTATNPGGTSAPATVTITVGAPAAPAVSAKSVTTAYNTAATIDLSGSITGVDITAVTIGTAPTHGSVSVSGETVTYTPSPTYYGGSDSFTYTATNPGGTSAPATVTITIGAPAAPTAAAKSVTTAYNTVATIDLSGSITGAGITAVTIGTAPTHGTVSVSGETVTYTPSSTYYGGSDSFTYTATNSGGTSAPATVTITVGAPAAPTVAAKSVTTAYDTAAAIDLSGSITGVDITTVTIGTAPTHGTVSVSGETVTYTPSSTYYGGSDSFTYTATNPGGTSTPATVTITVGAPAVPTAAAKSVSTAYNTVAAIDLSGSITGVDITAVTIGTAPAHGTVSVSGETVTYTPSSTYYGGSDSFTYTATNPGGTSAPATVTVTVGAPAAPTAAAKSVTTAYDTAASIDLSGSITGVDITTVTIGTAPTHGTVSVSGETVTYTPSPTFYGGTDSFTYTATNPGGTSAPATVTVTVGAPAAPTAAAKAVSTPYDTAASIDLSGSITGVDITAVAIGTAPLHGTVSVSGETVTYTPSSTYYGGTDSFTYTATNPGGTSTPATVTITVGAPAAPTAAAKSVSTAYNTVAAIDLSGSITGVDITAVTIGTAPTHGTVSVSGETVTYTPSSTYYGGSDSFTYTATNPGGTSAPATVTVTVGAPAAPTAAAKSVTTAYNTAATIDLSGSITGVDITAVTIGTVPTHGTVSVSGETVTYTPSSTYYGGSDSFTYTATNPGGTSAPATVTITVGAPTAPTAAAKSVSTAYNTAATIDLSGSITGVDITAVTIGTAPTHGTVSVSGETVTYTPSSTYYGGSDSFTYTATNPGGTSAPATVTITVGAPAAPTAATKSVTTAYNTAATIDLSGSITGVDITAVTIGTAPTHGTVSVSGKTVTYTPSSTYYGGSDSFTYTATNPGGTSAPATVTITVGAPEAPTAAARSVSTAYNTAATIDLSGSITGVDITAVTIGTAPTHGTVSVSGKTVTYTPSASYYGGSDSFTYTATNPGGTSAPATVTITVGLPPVPVVAARNATTAYNTAANVDLSGAITGVDITSIAVASAPSHGSVSVSGKTVTYTPSATFYGGTDSFTYTATNPGGTSAPATVTITVTPLSVPTAQALSVTTTTGASVQIQATAGATGPAPFTGVSVAQAPAHGQATASGEQITYTPAAGFTGTDHFTYQIANHFGSSTAATVTVTVTAAGQASAPDGTVTLTTKPATPVSTDLGHIVTGQYVSSTVLGLSPGGAGQVSISQPTTLSFTSVAGFHGLAQVTVLLTAADGHMATVDVLVLVSSQPDPSKNPDVLGLINAQTMEAQRFAQNQLDNIRQRLESLHDGNQQLFSSTLSMSLNGKPLQAPRMAGAGRLPGQRSIDGSDDRSGLATTTQPQSLMTMRPGIGGAGDNMMMLPDAAAPASDAADTSAGHAPPSRGPNGLAAWIDGTAAFGSFDSYRQAAGFDADSIAINTGIDQRLGEHGLFGLSLGYNHDRSTIANDGTRSIAQGYSAAMYGSFAPTPKTYLDAVLGGGGLSFDSRRRDSDNGSYLLGHRNGSQWFGSLTAGYEYHHQRWMISPYGRLEWSYSTLNGFAEKGDVVDALAYGQQTVRTSLAVLGVRTSGMIETAHAVLVPRARLEVGHDFQGTSDTTLSYAFVPSAGSWNVLTNPYSANGTSVQAGLGLDIQLPRSLTLTTDYSFMTQPHGHSQMIRFGLNKKF